MPPASRELTLERFEYSRVGEEWAVLRLLARLGAELGAPAQAQLVVSRGEDQLTPCPARACALERRLLAGSKRGVRRGDSELIWRASFAVPFAIVECQYAVFELTADDDLALALPAPGVRIVAPRPLALTPIRRAPRAQNHGIAVGHVRQRFVALATAVAVGATSTPAAALAASAVNAPSGPTIPTRTPTAPAGSTGTPGGPAGAGRTTPAAATPPPSGAVAATRPGAVLTPAAASGSNRNEQRAISSNPAPAQTMAATHPTVTHLFSAAARPADRPASKPILPATRCGSDTGTGPLAIGGTVAITRRLRARPVAPATCTPPATPKPAKRHAKPGQHQRSLPGATLVIDGANGNRTPSGPAGKPIRSGSGPHSRAHQHTPAVSKRPSGGAPEQPPGPLPAPPPVKLGSHPATSTHSVSTLSSSPSGFLAPSAWTGTVMANPALTGAVSDLSGLLSNGNRPPSFLIPIYMQAGHRYDVPWEVLAAINAIESDYGRNLNTSSAGAVGWMQFEPATWREWGVAADGHRVANPYDPRDAIFSAARYLAAAGAKQDIAKAVYAYNHATWYVDEVLSRAQAITQHAQFTRQNFKHGVFSVDFATGVKRHPTVRYTGSVMSHYDRLIASANMVSAANFPYVYAGGHEQPANFEPFDCSGSVSYVVQQAGYKVPTTASGGIPAWSFPAGPGRVTIFYNAGHTFMRIGGRFFGTSGFARPSGGAGWFNVDKLSAGYLSTFQEVHIPRLGTNSFAPTRARAKGRA